MKVISLWNPWAHLVAIGAKRFETRHWTTHHRGVLAIHAAKYFPPEIEGIALRKPCRKHWPGRCEVAFGAVVAVALMTDVEPTDSLQARLEGQGNFDEVAYGDYSAGRYAWRLDHAVRLERPLFIAGHQGLWNLTAEDEELVRGQMPPGWPGTPAGGPL